MIALGGVSFSERGEDQIDWIDRYAWHPVGQNIRYALAGNPVVQENSRSGRPITLTAELPWAWISESNMQALYELANTSQTLSFTFGSFSANVRFRRDQGPLQLTPVDPQKHYYTGSIYLIEV
jgi:hypothetical protein